jgi:hypothetical protein
MEQLQDFTARSAVRAGDQDHFSSTPAERAPIRPEWTRGFYSATNVLRALERCPQQRLNDEATGEGIEAEQRREGVHDPFGLAQRRCGDLGVDCNVGRQLR